MSHSISGPPFSNTIYACLHILGMALYVVNRVDKSLLYMCTMYCKTFYRGLLVLYLHFIIHTSIYISLKRKIVSTEHALV